MLNARLIAAIAVTGATLSSADGAIHYLGSGRMVSAQIGSASQSRTSTDNNPWTDTATATSGPALATLTSTQTSSFLPTGVTATGTLSYSRLMQDLTTGVARGSMSVFFTVDEATAYTLVANVAGGNSGSVTLINPGGTIHSGTQLNVAGVLTPAGGVYEIASSISLNAPQLGPGSVPWSVAFTVPTPGAAWLIGAAGAFTVARRRVRGR